MEFLIQKTDRPGKDKKHIPFKFPQHNGDFRLIMDYSVTSTVPGAVVPAGIIVQLIQKKTTAFVTNKGVERTLTTSAEISDYTKKQVENMCDTYLEYFEVHAGGEGADGDMFSNGAIAEYIKEGGKVVPYLDDEEDISRGTITQIGTNVFIKNGPEADRIRRLGWNRTKATPANGLPYMPFDKATWDYIYSKRNSDALVHTCTVTWGYKKDSLSKIVSVVAKRGGKRSTRSRRRRSIRRRR